MPVPPSALNLRVNPFGELEARAWGQVAVGPFGDLAMLLREPGTALQIVGACGRGKTSHLMGLAAALPEARYARVDRGGRPCAGGVYLMDEADHFGWPRRWWYLRRATSVAVATHRDMGRFLRVCGFRVVEVPVGGLDSERVRAMATRRIEAARAGPGAVPEVTDALVDGLVARYGDDHRAIQDALYEWIAGGADVAL